jgi:hypothetical protein
MQKVWGRLVELWGKLRISSASASPGLGVQQQADDYWPNKVHNIMFEIAVLELLAGKHVVGLTRLVNVCKPPTLQ